MNRFVTAGLVRLQPLLNAGARLEARRKQYQRIMGVLPFEVDIPADLAWRDRVTEWTRQYDDRHWKRTLFDVIPACLMSGSILIGFALQAAGKVHLELQPDPAAVTAGDWRVQPLLPLALLASVIVTLMAALARNPLDAQSLRRTGDAQIALLLVVGGAAIPHVIAIVAVVVSLIPTLLLNRGLARRLRVAEIETGAIAIGIASERHLQVVRGIDKSRKAIAAQLRGGVELKRKRATRVAGHRSTPTTQAPTKAADPPNRCNCGSP